MMIITPLRLLRVAAGLTLDEPGEHVGCVGTTVGRYEKGTTRLPDSRRKKLVRLYKARMAYAIVPLAADDRDRSSESEARAAAGASQ